MTALTSTLIKSRPPLLKKPPMTLPPEANVLEAALQALKHPPDTTHLPTLSRAVTRAADDLELVAEETPDRAVRRSLLVHVSHARKAVTAARQRARQAALTIDRTQLFESAQPLSKNEAENDTARLAREINDTLRRTTAIVSEEIDRSRAAGDVVEQSTRRLRMTRDQHGRYGHSLSSGADTLKSIRRTEFLANALIIASFAVFFLTSAYVTKRRIANSNISTFIIRPGMKAVSIPLRIVGWMMRAFGGVADKRGTAERPASEISSSAQQVDEAVKAREGRQKMEAVTGQEKDQKKEEVDDVRAGIGSPEENETCRTEQACMSRDESDTKPSTKQSAEVTFKRGDDSGERCKQKISQDCEDPSMARVCGDKVHKFPSEKERLKEETVLCDNTGVREVASPSSQLNHGQVPPDEELLFMDQTDETDVARER